MSSFVPHLGIALIAGFAAILFSALERPAWGEEFMSNSSVRIERHDRRQSKYSFKNTSLSINLGLLFEPSWQEQVSTQDNLFISYEELPNCASSEYKLEQVYEMKPESWLMDIVYYSADDREQQLAARRHKGIAVAYEPALVRRPDSNLPNYLQVYARFLRIECLPTRFRYVEIDSRRYREFSTGENAWQGSNGEKQH